MKQEDKELLLKDICARIPYGVKVNVVYSNENASSFRQRVCVEKDNELNTDIIWLYQHNEIDIKLYLFPLSSMTEEQEKEYDRVIELEIKAINDEINHTQVTAFEVDFYHKHHLDWRGLIPMGLAIDCTNLNIY